GAATQLAARRWRLRDLLRGRRGTAVADHAAGDRFVLIEAETALTLSLAAAPGQAVQVAAEAVSDVAETSIVLTGASILPPAPVGLAADDDADGGATIRWRRRGRSGWRWRDGADTPLGEEREQYRVTIVPSGAAARTLAVDTPAARVTAAERAAGPVEVTVAQIGTNGASPAATIVIRPRDPRS
ncbi:MAG: hypothetical protein JO221_07690, partial [Sphingomonas sp.]|nr:hypothetical protein [Sphingomonas sp.]